MTGTDDRLDEIERRIGPGPFAPGSAWADDLWLIRELRDARVENERLLRQTEIDRAFYKVTVKERDYERVKFDRMEAELAAERAKVQRVEALCDEGEAAELRMYPRSEAGGWLNTKRVRAALTEGEQE